VLSAFAVPYLLLGHQRFVRRITARNGRAVDDYGAVVAPLMAFALVGLLVDSRPSDT
jgi:hypothetical protein